MNKKKQTKPVHVAVDLDKTCAIHKSEWGISKIGPPIKRMVLQVKKWLKLGYKISIFTARANTLDHSPWEVEKQKKMIRKFLKQNGLPDDLDITATKRTYFSHFIDDRAYHVKKNKGIISDEIDI